MNRPKNKRRGRPPKGGQGSYVRLPDDLRAFIKDVWARERRESFSSTAVALLYEIRDIRAQRAA